MCRRRSGAGLAVCSLLLATVCVPGIGRGAGLPHRVFIPSAARTTPPTASAPPAVDVAGLINERRRAAGCDAVRYDDTLAAAARRHSVDMATNDFVDHTGSDGSDFSRRAREADYTFFASGE